jgi:hypothetical protein
VFQLSGLDFIFLDGIASFICQFKMENRKDTTLIYAKPLIVTLDLRVGFFLMRNLSIT